MQSCDFRLYKDVGQQYIGENMDLADLEAMARYPSILP